MGPRTLRILLTAISAMALPSCRGGSADGPGGAVLGLYGALEAGDGARAVSLLSSGALLEIGERLEELAADPASSSEQLAMLGIPIDPYELEGMTAARFAEVLYSSGMVRGIVRSGTVSIESVETDGDSAEVRVRCGFPWATSTRRLTVVLEDGAWRVATL